MWISKALIQLLAIGLFGMTSVHGDDGQIIEAHQRARAELRKYRLNLIYQRSVQAAVSVGAYFTLGNYYESIGGLMNYWQQTPSPSLEVFGRVSLLGGSFVIGRFTHRYLNEEFDAGWKFRTLSATAVGMAFGLGSPGALNLCRQLVSTIGF